MQQKIIQIGNSQGITLSKTVLQDLNATKTGSISLVKNPDNKTYTLMQSGESAVSSITPHFLNVLERVNKVYGSALKELAGK